MYTETDRICSLLGNLDRCIQLRRVCTAAIAIDDKSFLQYDSQSDLALKDATALGRTLDATTALLNRLQRYSDRVGAYAVNFVSNRGQDIWAELLDQKTLANLEHMLNCLRYATLEALAYCYLQVVGAEFAHWHSYWQQRWQTGDAWFAEWPGGRRPLNTTWPWDVKTSLLVLWGVCWMFYGNGGMPRKPQAAGFFSESTSEGQPPQATPQPGFSITGKFYGHI